MSSITEKIPLSLLVWWPIVEVITEVYPVFRSLRSADACRSYPDGTVEVNSPLEVQRVRERLAHIREDGLEIRQKHSLSSIGSFYTTAISIAYDMEVLRAAER